MFRKTRHKITAVEKADKSVQMEDNTLGLPVRELNLVATVLKRKARPKELERKCKNNIGFCKYRNHQKMKLHNFEHGVPCHVKQGF